MTSTNKDLNRYGKDSSQPSTSRVNGSGPVVHTLTANPKDKDLTYIIPPPNRCSYVPCFCEENVWKLADGVRQKSPNELSKCQVVFVSNKKRVVPLWRQKAGRDEDKLVIWDYHVIFIYRPDDRCLVYDLDTELPFPTYFHKYVTETFRTDAILNVEYHRYFRVIPANQFLNNFSSDRRHMKRSDGSWIKDPPSYPCIQLEKSLHNLDKFVSMEKSEECLGEVVGLKEFIQMFYSR